MGVLTEAEYEPFGVTYHSPKYVTAKGLKTKDVRWLTTEVLVAVSNKEPEEVFKYITGYCLWQDILDGKVKVTTKGESGIANLMVRSPENGVDYRVVLYPEDLQGVCISPAEDKGFPEIPIIVCHRKVEEEI